MTTPTPNLTNPAVLQWLVDKVQTSRPETDDRILCQALAQVAEKHGFGELLACKLMHVHRDMGMTEPGEMRSFCALQIGALLYFPSLGMQPGQWHQIVADFMRKEDSKPGQSARISGTVINARPLLDEDPCLLQISGLLEDIPVRMELAQERIMIDPLLAYATVKKAGGGDPALDAMTMELAREHGVVKSMRLIAMKLAQIYETPSLLIRTVSVHDGGFMFKATQYFLQVQPGIVMPIQVVGQWATVDILDEAMSDDYEPTQTWATLSPGLDADAVWIPGIVWRGAATVEDIPEVDAVVARIGQMIMGSKTHQTKEGTAVKHALRL